MLSAVAALFPSEFVFVVVDVDQGSHRRCVHVHARGCDLPSMEHFFGVLDAELPTLRILDLDNGGAKYKYTHAVTKQRVTQWLSDFKAGSLAVRCMTGSVFTQHTQPYRKAEATSPQWQQQLVKPLTAETVDAFLATPDRAVVLLTCATINYVRMHYLF